MKNKVMIVEDEVLIGMMIKKKIEERGYEVCDIPTTGELAISRAAEEQPDVIVMDIFLASNMTGIEAAKIIHEKSKTPIVFFTGNNNDAKLIEQSQIVNPIAIVNKLGSSEELFAAIEKALQQ